jgi:tetratricopeptide (TPR) repeat protein
MSPWLRVAMVAAVGIVGCAPAARVPDVPPSELARLEAERAARPDDPAAMLRLGAGLHSAGRHAEAVDVLRSALAVAPSFAASVWLGLAFEAQGSIDSALAAYRRAVPLARTGAERSELERRLAIVTRARLALAARDAVARESALTRSPPVPNAIAVLPWTYLGTDEALRPLERGLAHLLVTDLGRVSTLVLLEREQVQLLVDELDLAASSFVEPRTAARPGRLLRAGRVVHGTLREAAGTGLRLDASAVATTTGRVAATSSATDALAALFDMEKRLVFGLLEGLRITLSPAERRAIAERPTADLQAFLAFSRGLAAQDRGDFAAARAHFDAALARDATFRAARELRGRAIALAASPSAAALAAATGVDIVRAGGGLRASALRAAVQDVVPTLAGRLATRASIRSPLVRSGTSETFRQDDPTRLGSVGEIVIVIPRP